MNTFALTLSLLSLFSPLSLSKCQINQSAFQPTQFFKVTTESYTTTKLSDETDNCQLRDVLNGTEIKPQLCWYNYDVEALEARIPDYPIHPMILSRHSSYVQTGESITDEELFGLLEAMRWGPSNYNIQPWRIVYAHRGTPTFNEFLSIQTHSNQVWNVYSSVLMAIVSDMYTRHKGNITFLHTNSFSTGLAFGGLALEASARGYLIHPITGFDEQRAAKALGISNNKHFKIEVFCAIGKRLPLSKLGEKNIIDQITQRKKMPELVSRDIFKTDWIY